MVWLTVSRLIVLHPQHHPRPLLLALIWPLIRLLSAIKDLFGLSPSPYWLVKWMHSLGCDSFLYFIVVLHSFFFFQTNNETRNHGWGQDIDVCDIDVWSLHLVRSALSLPMVINTEPHYVHLYVGCVCAEMTFYWFDLDIVDSNLILWVGLVVVVILSVIRTYIICFMFLKQKLLWIN